MLDNTLPSPAAAGGHDTEGPDDAGGALGLLRCMLEHVDYGLALVDIGSRRLRLANAAALRALGDGDGGLSLAAGQVRARQGADDRQLDRAMTLAANGVRELVQLTARDSGSTVAVVPLGDAGRQHTVLLVFARNALCDRSALALFARACELTAAESSVLAAVCTGLRPHEVAREHGVRVSTIRSQIQSIRQKTRCNSLRELLYTVSRLPPVARQIG